MERKVKFADLEAAVVEAYEKFKSEKEGTVDPRLADADVKKFGITVVLPDGTTIEKADTDAEFALGNIAQIPTAALLLQNNSPEELLKKSGACSCHDTADKDPEVIKKLKELPLSRRLLRAVSAIEPTGDPDGKMDIISDNLIAMAGTSPVLDDKLYKAILAQAHEADIENVLAKAGFYLYDDAATAVDIVSKLYAMKVNTTQLATLGATILADGFNPVTKQNVFDGSISERLVAAMASLGPVHHVHGWLVGSGVPAMASFSGGMLGIVPGTLAIAAYSPLLNEKGVPVKAAHAIRYIANKLQINAFASAKVVIEK